MGKAQCHHGASTQLSARAVISSSTLEHKPDDWPWGNGCDTDRQGPLCSILYTCQPVPGGETANALVHRQAEKTFRSYDSCWHGAALGSGRAGL